MLILYTPVDSYFPVQWGQKEKGDMQYMQYKRVRLWPCKIDLNPPVTLCYEGGSESSVIGVITLLIDMINCCIIP